MNLATKSTDNPPLPVSARPRSGFWRWVALCLAVQAILAADCARRWTATHDEYWHLPIGLRMWTLGKFDDDVINPPLVRLWAALPLALAGVSPGEAGAKPDVGDIGDAFWAANRQTVQTWYWLGRLMIIPLSTAIGLMLAWWGRHWYGEQAGLLSAFLWACCPTALANAAIVTHDLPLAAAWMATLLTLVLFAERPNPIRAILFGAFLGIALLTKLTAILLGPLSVVLWFVLRVNWRGAASEKPLANKSQSSSSAVPVTDVSEQTKQSGYGSRPLQQISLWLLAAVTTLVVLNACYLFRGTGTRWKDLPVTSTRLKGLQTATGPALGRVPVPIPREFILAADRLARDLETKHPLFLNGQWSTEPFSAYYAWALLYKVPLSTLVLLLIALAACFTTNGSPLERRHTDRRRAAWLLIAAGTLPLLASQSPNQIGIRYVLPTLPLLCLFAGQAAKGILPLRRASASNEKRSPASKASSQTTATSPQSSAWQLRVSGAVWCAVVLAPLALRHHPNHIPYFNLIAGGPDGGRRCLSDSNLDWGQDLHGLKHYLDQHPAPNLRLAYYGTVIPSRVGIEAAPPPSRQPQPGWYAVSVNFVQGRPHAIRDSNGDRTAVGIHEFGYFQFFEPVAKIGHSIDVYHLTDRDVGRYHQELSRLQP